jgi:diguanylate cyclase (GGDEF)-like protein
LDKGTFDELGRENQRLQRELEETRRRLAEAQAEVEQLKLQDTLTGLGNRKKLDLRIDEEIPRWERYRRPLALVLMQLDDFGVVNEQYGRGVGDEVLLHVATMVGQSVRGVDLAVRYGGKEFAVLLPETNEMGAMIVAERLRMELESQIILPLVQPLTGSFGVAMLLPGESRDELYARAGRAVQHSKKHGKNRVTMAGVIGECDHLYQGGQTKETDNV